MSVNPTRSEEQQLFAELLEWANLSQDARWQALSTEERAQIVQAVKEIAAIPVVQAEEGAPVQFVSGKNVFNVRRLVVPAIVAILVKATVLIAPGLDSALLPVLDAIHFAEKAREVYRKLTDDEVDVFGAVSDLYTESKLRHSVTDPGAHPTAHGVEAWFRRNDYEAPPDIRDLLESLYDKGALLRETLPSGEYLYAPTFLGKKAE